MINLYDNETDAPLGQITEQQLQYMIDHFEEEANDDTAYWVDRATLDMLTEKGADPALVAALRQALGSREGVDVRWERAS